MLKNSSELIKAAKLLKKLIEPKATTVLDSVISSNQSLKMEDDSSSSEDVDKLDKLKDPLLHKTKTQQIQSTPKSEISSEKSKQEETPQIQQSDVQLSILKNPQSLSPKTDIRFSGNNLEEILFKMSIKGGFSNVAIVDSDEFVVAEVSNKIKSETTDIVSLFTLSSVFKDMITQSAIISNYQNIDTIIIYISLSEKLLIKKFSVNKSEYFLLVVCLQEIDERKIIQEFIPQITSFLK